MTTFRLPDLGEGLQEAEIVAWHVTEGDHVVADQPLVSVETEKAVVEIPSPQSGYVTERFGEPGDVLAVGDDLVAFSDKAASDPGGIVGDLDQEAEAHPDTDSRPGAVASSDRPRATPAVRALADRLKVDLGTVKGTGPGGSISSEDVRTAAEVPGAAAKVSGVRRSMFAAMTRAHATVVPATITDDACIDHWPVEADVTIRLIQAIAAGVASVPILNAWLDPAGPGLTPHDRIDLGIATDTGDGLFVPVLRDAGNRSKASLRTALEEIKRQVSERTIPAKDLRGQTLTLSNFGMLAGRYATLVIVPPQVAILGAGRIERRPWVMDDAVRACRTLPLSLTFDHRAVTGGEATRFLSAVIDTLEDREAENDHD